MPDYQEIPASAPMPDSSQIPNPVRPIVEHRGWVMPYRGQVAHGVDPNLSPPDPVPDIFDEGHVTPVTQKPPERAEVPVPVRIVNEGSREKKTFGTGQDVVTGQSAMIAGEDLSRTSLTIRNMSATVTIYIGNRNSANVVSGFPIDAGSDITLSGCQDAIYAVSADGSTVPVALLWEYTVEL